MKPTNKIEKDQKEKVPFGLTGVHPYKVMLYFSIVGLSLLFVGMSFAYVFTTQHEDWSSIPLPNIFFVSTALILFSSYAIHQAKISFNHNKYLPHRFWLAVTLLSSILFVCSQYLGWMSLNAQNVLMSEGTSKSYLYLISGLHVVHVLAGIVALMWYSILAFRQTSNGLVAMVYFTDEVKKLKLNLLTIYWHFIDVLWLYLLLFFVVNKLL